MLDAGLELFGTAGYATTTIEGLCGAASLNARYFYEQFRSREDLLTAVYQRHTALVSRAVSAALASAPDPALHLEAGLRAFVEATLTDERGARINYVEVVGVSPTLERLRHRTDREYADLITREAARIPRLQARGTEERRAFAVALIGAVDGLLLDWLSGERNRPSSMVVDTLISVFGPAIG